MFGWMKRDTRCEKRDDQVTLVCCGYRYITSSKTLLRFPAWLIQFDDGCYWWRAKRDFLRLFRASNAQGQSSSLNLVPPKASLEKLCTNAPWRRPEYDNNGGRLVASFDEQETNNYHVSMKKSLFQLDQYLNAVSRCVQEKQEGPLVQAWLDFSRNEHVSELHLLLRSTESPTTPPPSLDWPSILKSSQLGQYFCTLENAKQVCLEMLIWCCLYCLLTL